LPGLWASNSHSFPGGIYDVYYFQLQAPWSVRAAVVGPAIGVHGQEIADGCDRRAAIYAAWYDRRDRWYRGGAGGSGAGLAEG
jgi:hypothetical protein